MMRGDRESTVPRNVKHKRCRKSTYYEVERGSCEVEYLTVFDWFLECTFSDQEETIGVSL